MTLSRTQCSFCSRTLEDGWTRCPYCVETPDSAVSPHLPAELSLPATDVDSLSLDPARRYQVLSILGKGAQGIVYKVHDRELDELIALKVLSPRVDSPLARERFKREIKIARRINHPNVARLHDLILWNNRLAISQEFIDGQDLASRLREGPFSLSDIRTLLRYLCSAIDAAHSRGVIHRDLKPQNVLLDRRGVPHIVDFGIAVLGGVTAEEERKFIFGTPAYIAPEQILDPGHIERRSDIYSLGVILFQLATGRVPFGPGKPADILSAHVSEEPPRPRSLRPEVSIALEAVTLRCLAKDPKRRYGCGQELLHDLEQRLEHEHRGVVPPVAVHRGLRGKVLVIDDDEDLRQWIRTILRASGAVVIEAEDGYRGMELALAEKPDLVLLDILMPNLDGREVLRILKSNRLTASIPVVMVTSLSDDEEALFSKESGAAAFLNKPVQSDVLELLVERYLAAPSRAALQQGAAPRG